MSFIMSSRKRVFLWFGFGILSIAVITPVIWLFVGVPK
jgi:hypothetical protein